MNIGDKVWCVRSVGSKKSYPYYAANVYEIVGTKDRKKFFRIKEGIWRRSKDKCEVDGNSYGYPKCNYAKHNTMV